MTKETILVAIAWPYANAPIHVGNLTGTHLPGDIVARYHRLKGDRVLMVSGTDSHGTPVTLRADADGKPVEEVYQFFHNQFLDLLQQVGISYDLFTTTHTANHFGSRSPSSWRSRRMATFTPKRARSGTPRRRGNFYPTGTWRALATCAAPRAPVPTSAITAATCSSLKS